MKLLAAMIRYELKLQLRSARFRIAAIGYVAACALGPALLYFQWRHRAGEVLGWRPTRPSLEEILNEAAMDPYRKYRGLHDVEGLEPRHDRTGLAE